MNKTVTLRDAAKKVAIVLVAALIATLLTPSMSDAATTTKVMTTDTETGAYSNGIDPTTKAYTAKVVLSATTLTFTSYTSGDWDFIDGTDYWSYRTTNGITTVQYRVGTAAGSMTGRPSSESTACLGVYEFYDGARIIEKHTISTGIWKREAFDVYGAISASISKVLTTSADRKTSTVTTTIISDAPVATPSATPTATPTPTPTATAPVVTPPPFVAPTLPPVATPSATPVATPSATPAATPTATPPATPSATPEATPSGNSQVVAPTPVSNFSDLKHSTKIEKKAYSSLKTLENLAKKYGWGEKRTYTRKSSSKKKVKTSVYYKGDFGGDLYTTFKFTQVVKKSGKKYVVSYYQNGKKVSTSGVKKVIQRKIK